MRFCVFLILIGKHETLFLVAKWTKVIFECPSDNLLKYEIDKNLMMYNLHLECERNK